MRGNGHRRPKESFNQPPPPTPQFRRDSDASFTSSRPSSVGKGRGSTLTVDRYKERAVQISAVSFINSSLRVLFSHSFDISFKPFSPPPLRDISETINLLLQSLDYHPTKLEDDLLIILKALKYPFKINKSILKTPPAPHQWYTILALIHWLVQIAMYNHHLASDPRLLTENNDVNGYALDSYLNYMRGDDDSVEALDQEFLERLERERDNAVGNLKVEEQSVADLEAKAEVLRSAPSQREVLEQKKSVLEEDVGKFHMIISGLTEKIEELKKVLDEKEKELGAKLEENKRICEENEELKMRVESQAFNPRDVERMRRELQAVERDIAEAEVSRNAWEEKIWELDATVGHKYKEIEALAMECNQALRRLKLDNVFQYTVNANGSTPAEIMGIDYKTTIKPALDSLADDIKRCSMSNLEVLVSLRQQSNENASKIEHKRNHMVSLQSHIDEAEAQLDLLRQEIQDYNLRCVAEAKKMLEGVQSDAHNMDVVEKEAAEILMSTKLKLQEAIRQSEEEIQMRARELLALVDSVSRYKECVASKISEMKSNVSETAVTISKAYKSTFPVDYSKKAKLQNEQRESQQEC